MPHPEWSGGRCGANVDAPGYLINYAFGAFITADIRARAAWATRLRRRRRAVS
ncbi:MAG: hypothetical protein U0133_06495 [Gemmatimonadales bacterium]